jgi:hypothetical protein
VAAVDVHENSIRKDERRTALYDAIEMGITMFGESRPGDTVCVITDGGENSSRYGKSQIVKSLPSTGIRVSGILVNSFNLNVRGREAAAADVSNGFRSLIRVSRGMAYELQTGDYPFRSGLSLRLLEYLGNVCRTFVQQVSFTYQLQVRPLANHSKPEGWKPEVIGQDGKGDPRLSVLYPRLSPCKTTP